MDQYFGDILIDDTDTDFPSEYRTSTLYRPIRFSTMEMYEFRKYTQVQDENFLNSKLRYMNWVPLSFADVASAVRFKLKKKKKKLVSTAIPFYTFREKKWPRSRSQETPRLLLFHPLKTGRGNRNLIRFGPPPPPSVLGSHCPLRN